MNDVARIDRRLAAANPVPTPDRLEITVREMDALLARVVALPRRPREFGQRRAKRGWRPLLLGAAALLAIFVPAVALATHHRLLGFSNPGQPVNTASLSLDQTSGFRRAGVMNALARLGERNGVVFYRASRGQLACYEASDSAGRGGAFMQCENTGAAAFPSPEEPIVDLSNPLPPAYPRNYPRQASYIRQLAGVAADGVARVGFVTADGAIHSTPVVNNVYASARMVAPLAASQIVALDKDGGTVFREDLRQP
jgi:hypothetical protein